MNNNRRVGNKFGGLKGRGFARNKIKLGELKVRCITNQFADVRLASLASWREANEIFLWDRGGPYIVTQQGCDPDDLTMTPDEFVLGRLGQWLSLEVFFRMPVAERWKGFVFSTGSEVLRVMRDLPLKAVTWQPAPGLFEEIVSFETDAMAVAFHSSKKDTCRAVR